MRSLEPKAPSVDTTPLAPLSSSRHACCGSSASPWRELRGGPRMVRAGRVRHQLLDGSTAANSAVAKKPETCRGALQGTCSPCPPSRRAHLHPLHLVRPVAARVARPPRAADRRHCRAHGQPRLAHAAAHEAVAAKHLRPRSGWVLAGSEAAQRGRVEGRVAPLLPPAALPSCHQLPALPRSSPRCAAGMCGSLLGDGKARCVEARGRAQHAARGERQQDQESGDGAATGSTRKRAESSTGPQPSCIHFRPHLPGLRHRWLRRRRRWRRRQRRRRLRPPPRLPPPWLLPRLRPCWGLHCRRC